MQRYQIYKGESKPKGLGLGDFIAGYQQLPAASRRVTAEAHGTQCPWGAILVDTRTGLWDVGDGWQDPSADPELAP